VKLAPVARIVLLVALTGCATPVARHTTPVELDRSSVSAEPVRFEADVTIPLPSNMHADPIRAGSTWLPTGTIPQGTVYASKESVLMVNAAERHEALPVIHEGAIAGFYLPYEHAFLAATSRVPIPKH
jgi:hypothetical protein